MKVALKHPVWYSYTFVSNKYTKSFKKFAFPASFFFSKRLFYMYVCLLFMFIYFFCDFLVRRQSGSILCATLLMLKHNKCFHFIAVLNPFFVFLLYLFMSLPFSFRCYFFGSLGYFKSLFFLPFVSFSVLRL